MLTQVDVRLFWESIEPGLREIKEEASTEWRTEDIYTALVNGIAELYIDEEQKNCESFIILQEKPQVFQPAKSLLIWVAYDKRGKAADIYMDYIENMARERGCTKIEFWTPYINLAHSLSSKGYKIKNYLTEKEL